LEPEYYRYAQSLRAINQNDKANEVMELFKNQPMMAEPNFKQNTTIYKPLKLILEGTLSKMLESIRSILIMELLFIRIN
jgi:hypothetical protein